MLLQDWQLYIFCQRMNLHNLQLKQIKTLFVEVKMVDDHVDFGNLFLVWYIPFIFTAILSHLVNMYCVKAICIFDKPRRIRNTSTLLLSKRPSMMPTSSCFFFTIRDWPDNYRYFNTFGNQGYKTTTVNGLVNNENNWPPDI